MDTNTVQSLSSISLPTKAVPGSTLTSLLSCLPAMQDGRSLFASAQDKLRCGLPKVRIANGKIAGSGHMFVTTQSRSTGELTTKGHVKRLSALEYSRPKAPTGIFDAFVIKPFLVLNEAGKRTAQVCAPTPAQMFVIVDDVKTNTFMHAAPLAKKKWCLQPSPSAIYIMPTKNSGEREGIIPSHLNPSNLPFPHRHNII